MTQKRLKKQPENSPCIYFLNTSNRTSDKRGSNVSRETFIENAVVFDVAPKAEILNTFATRPLWGGKATDFFERLPTPDILENFSISPPRTEEGNLCSPTYSLLRWFRRFFPKG